MATAGKIDPRTAEHSIAESFVAARRSGKALSGYPGSIPADLAASYRCQDAAIELWDDEIVGWKVGGIAPANWQALGSSRVAGPVFARALRRATIGKVVDFPVFQGGFAAVEAEFTMRLGQDAPAGQIEWSIEQAFALIDEVFISIETAGSPLATINALGSLVVASDFGNNHGLILGAPVAGWRDRAFEHQVCRTEIDGKTVGTGSGQSLAGGPLESLRLLLGICAKRGRPLRAGLLVATGAVTGVHDIKSGQTAHIDFGDYGAIDCRAVDFGKAR